MARKPNYDFEKKERERLKTEKKAARANSKVQQTEPDADTPKQDATESGEPE